MRLGWQRRELAIRAVASLGNRDASGPFRPASRRRWPVGERYFEAFPGAHAWVEYKLAAAQWHWDALREVETAVPELHRYMGVEMAVDGLLAAASSAIDASIGLIVGALVARRTASGVTVPSAITNELWRPSARLALDLANLPPTISFATTEDLYLELVQGGKVLGLAWRLRRERESIQDQPIVPTARLAAIDGELAGLETWPVGKVAELRWLRNRTSHEDTLTRAFGVTNRCMIHDPWRQPHDPTPYLRECLDACQQLVRQLLADAAAI